MELCEFCAEFETCKLDKRVNDLWEERCRSFQLLGDGMEDRYARVHSTISALQKERDSSKEVSRLDLRIPLEVSEDDLLGSAPSDLYLRFLTIDLSNEQERHGFLREFGLLREAEPLALDIFLGGDEQGLLDAYAVREDLAGMLERWKENPEDFGEKKVELNLDSGRLGIPDRVYWNEWDSRISPKDELLKATSDLDPSDPDVRDFQSTFAMSPKEAIAAIPLTKPEEAVTDLFRVNAWVKRAFAFRLGWVDGAYKLGVTTDLGHWYGVLYLLFALDVVKNQDILRCPVCQTFFKPKKSGPMGATCGKPRCKTELSRHRESYLKAVSVM